MTRPTSPPQPLATPREVEQLVRAAREEGRVAIDTEFHWERTYAPILCLLQAATRDRLVLIDPLEGGDVGPIDELVADPEIQLVMHAPSADLGLHAYRPAISRYRISRAWCGVCCDSSPACPQPGFDCLRRGA